MKRLWLVIAAAYALSLVLDVALGARYLGVFPAFGLVGCVAIIVVSKWLGKAWLQQPDPELASTEPVGRPRDA